MQAQAQVLRVVFISYAILSNLRFAFPIVFTDAARLLPVVFIEFVFLDKITQDLRAGRRDFSRAAGNPQTRVASRRCAQTGAIGSLSRPLDKLSPLAGTLLEYLVLNDTMVGDITDMGCGSGAE